MKRLILAVMLFVPTILLTDFLVMIVHARLFRSQIASEEILPALCNRIRPGMERSEVENQIDGFREIHRESRDQGYAIAYGYWFGFVPPLSRSGLKFIGEIVVDYSADGRVKAYSFWYN